MWRDDPATTMVIGWNQVSGANPVVHFDVVDYGLLVPKYAFSQASTNSNMWKGMKNYYARLTGLKPATTYYFVIKDSEGVSVRMSFTTAPATKDARLSIVSGGDSRNNREARRNANILAGKLRPTVILFNGDMTESETDLEWQGWMDDWQYNITPDGHLSPLIVARGNHEQTNESLVNLFDVAAPHVYYTTIFAGGLLRVITLNSLIPVDGDQRIFLENELKSSKEYAWTFAQYHYPMRPHHSAKSEHDKQVANWATLFAKYGVQIAFESDSHVAKLTWPIKPSLAEGSDEGFIRDEARGTIYVGEGCWGAPLRANDDDKTWTRASGSFNHFNWVWVDAAKAVVRTVKTDNAAEVAMVSAKDIFNLPANIDLWTPEGVGTELDVSRKVPASYQAPDEVVMRAAFAVTSFNRLPSGGDINIKWRTQYEQDGMTFELQRSIDAEPFTTVVKLKGKGSDNTENQYSVLDKGCMTTHKGKYIAYRVKCIPPSGAADFYDPQVEAAESESTVYLPDLEPDEHGFVRPTFKITTPGDISIGLYNSRTRQVWSEETPAQKPGQYQRGLDMSDYPIGRYILIVRSNKTVIQRFVIRKRA